MCCSLPAAARRVCPPEGTGLDLKIGKDMENSYRNISFRIMAAAVLLLAAACSGEEKITPGIPQEVTPPASVYLSGAGETSLTFSWRSVEGAEYYTARLEEGDGTFVKQNLIQENTITFTGLVTGQTYLFKVQVKTADGESGYSEPVEGIPGVSVPGEDPGTDESDVPLEGYERFLIPSCEDNLGALAFPGAEGGGMYTAGGRGGRVVHVTNLDDSGEGSLRAAVEASGARTVVFDVAGRIDLETPLKITNGDLTIAGQTAPGDGICISGNTVEIQAGNVIIRFIRFRLGDAGSNLGDSSDAFWGRYNDNIIIDHCSMSWSIDECASFYANRNFTLQWCLIAEALNESRHSKGGHGYGGIWGGRNASFHHNLLANNNSRNARIDHPQIYGDKVSTHRGNVDYRNNVIYNWGSNSTYGGEDGHFNIVGNYYKPGPGSEDDRRYFVDAYWYYEKDGKVYADSYPELYLEDNYHTEGIDGNRYPDGIYRHDQSGDAGKPNPEVTILTAPLPIKANDTRTCYTSTHSASAVFGKVLDYSGASYTRDDVDRRIAEEARSGEAVYGNGIINSQEEVGGWPEYAATVDESASVTDTDGDGMPDWFEEEFGVSDASAKSLDPQGRYTDLEMYLHYLVRDIIAAQNSGAVYTAL